jgi:DNA-binding LytR/AlgR family response regulator
MYRISVCDDNSAELEKICDMISEYVGAINIPVKISAFSSGRELLEHEETDADIYILDIIMPDMNGIELGQALRRKTPRTYIIFLTTSKDYALESYSVKAFSYLIKPIEKEKITAELSDCFFHIRKPKRHFVLKCAAGTTSVCAEDIIYIEYYNHRMIYHITGGDTLESIYFRVTFDSMIAEYIENGSFVKSSASYLVNMEHIRTVNAVGFVMSDGTVLPVTRKYAEARKKYIDYELNGGKYSDNL